MLGQPCEAVWGTLDRQGYIIHTSPGFLAKQADRLTGAI